VVVSSLAVDEQRQLVVFWRLKIKIITPTYTMKHVSKIYDSFSATGSLECEQTFKISKEFRVRSLQVGVLQND
jgi:hypothetical protein